MSEAELLVPFPDEEAILGVATEVRSTLIASSITSLRRNGHFERYEPQLAEEHREVVLSAVAGVWLPMAAARAHYLACETLGLSTHEQLKIGAEVSHKIHQTLLGVVVRMARQAGVTPWPLLSRGNQMYGRLFRGGGGLRVLRCGPKEARADLTGIPLLAIPYFRHALRGIYLGAVSLFCMQAYAHEIPRESTATRIALRVSWV